MPEFGSHFQTVAADNPADSVTKLKDGCGFVKSRSGSETIEPVDRNTWCTTFGPIRRVRNAGQAIGNAGDPEVRWRGKSLAVAATVAYAMHVPEAEVIQHNRAEGVSPPNGRGVIVGLADLVACGSDHQVIKTALASLLVEHTEDMVGG